MCQRQFLRERRDLNVSELCLRAKTHNPNFRRVWPGDPNVLKLSSHTARHARFTNSNEKKNSFSIAKNREIRTNTVYLLTMFDVYKMLRAILQLL